MICRCILLEYAKEKKTNELNYKTTKNQKCMVMKMSSFITEDSLKQVGEQNIIQNS